ncbi:hypothetical protein [Streptomyces violaceusniger]|uniref:hypothetical protein n=1 Tax=Streptomyces violaceusniger TaxID=68280 RepID=UPI001386B220
MTGFLGQGLDELEATAVLVALVGLRTTGQTTAGRIGDLNSMTPAAVPHSRSIRRPPSTHPGSLGTSRNSIAVWLRTPARHP